MTEFSEQHEPDALLEQAPQEYDATPAESDVAGEEQLALANPEQGDIPDLVPEAPDLYSLGLENLDMEIDLELERNFKSKAHELGLTQNQARELARLYAEHQEYAHAGLQERLTGTLVEAEQGWVREMMRDKNFDEDVSRARAAVRAYGSDEFAQILDQTRLGSHPAFVKFMAQVGRDLAEPAFQRAQFAQSERSPAEVLYPNQGRG